MKKEEIILQDHEVDATGKRLRPFLKQAEANVAPGIAIKLASARAAAVARAVELEADRAAAQSAVSNGNTLAMSGPSGWKQRAMDWRFWATGLIVGALIVTYSLNQVRESSATRDAAEVELMILGDDVPVDALLDKGFSSYLREENK